MQQDRIFLPQIDILEVYLVSILKILPNEIVLFLRLILVIDFVHLDMELWDLLEHQILRTLLQYVIVLAWQDELSDRHLCILDEHGEGRVIYFILEEGWVLVQQILIEYFISQVQEIILLIFNQRIIHGSIVNGKIIHELVEHGWASDKRLIHSMYEWMLVQQHLMFGIGKDPHQTYLMFKELQEM